MKRLLAVMMAMVLCAGAAYGEVRGSWTASTNEEKDGRIHFTMNRRKNWNNGNTFLISRFTGLSEAQIHAGAQTPVQFQMRSEAGNIDFDGFFRGGDGAGQFTFKPNPQFLQTLKSMGLEPKIRERSHEERSDEDELFSLAVHDVSTDFIRTMRAEGFDARLEKYVSMRIFNVTPEYVREMRGLGYKDISADKLVETKIHKVTPDYIRRMRAAGWDLPLNKLVASRIHGATPEFAAEMSRLGYSDLDHDDLIAFRIHRVTPEFIEELRKLGYDKVDADDLIAARIHRVTPEFIREVQAAGYRNVPLDKLVKMRIHGVDANFIKKMNDVD